jgi:hypothetical protein
MTRREAIFIAALLLIGHIQLETAELLEKFYPADMSVHINPFWDSSYKFPVCYGCKPGIQLKWWIKYVCDDLLYIIYSFCAAYVAGKMSRRLFKICGLFFGYHVIDHILLWYNYRSVGWYYWILAAVMVFWILFILVPEQKQAILKSMK